jgi:uncharacterized membrane protein YczE
MIESRHVLGLGPWDAFHVGLSVKSGMSVGTASILAGLVVQIGAWFLGIRPGVATIANMILIGVFINLLSPLIPDAQGWAWALAYYIPGILLCGLSTGFYIAAGLGKGPRDGLMLGVSDLVKWPVRRVRTIIEVVVLSFGWLMGAPVGVGTLMFAFGIGPAVQWGLRLCGVIEGSDAQRPAATVALQPLKPAHQSINHD